MYHTIYKITNNLNDKFYIGTHSTNDLNDNYMGSGLGIKRAIAKYGIDNFTKRTLFIFSSRNEMFAMEKLLVDSVFVSQIDTYNGKVGGKGGSIKGRKMPDSMVEKVKARMLRDNWQRGKPGVFKGKFGMLHHKSKSVAQINIETGLIVDIFGSIREATRKTGINNINSCCQSKGKHKTAGGYKWKYYDPWRGY